MPDYKPATRKPRFGRTTADGAPKPMSDSKKRALPSANRSESRVNPPPQQAKVSETTHVRAAFLRATGVSPRAGVGDGDANSAANRSGPVAYRSDRIKKANK